MSYSVKYSDTALKSLKKIDRQQAKIIIAWIEKKLEGCDDPRLHGKALRYDREDEWRYRIGAYRLIADIQDDIVTIEIVKAGHRKSIYS